MIDLARAAEDLLDEIHRADEALTRAHRELRELAASLFPEPMKEAKAA